MNTEQRYQKLLHKFGSKPSALTPVLTTVKNEIAENVAMLLQTEEEIIKAQAVLDKTKAEYETLQKQIPKLGAEIKEKKLVVSDLKIEETGYTYRSVSYRGTIEALEKEMVKLDKDLKALEQLIQNTKKNKEDIDIKVVVSKDELKHILSDIEGVENLLSSKEKEMKDQEKQHTEKRDVMNKEIEELKKKHEEQIAQMRKEYEEEKKGIEERLSELKKKREEAEGYVSSKVFFVNQTIRELHTIKQILEETRKKRINITIPEEL